MKTHTLALLLLLLATAAHGGGWYLTFNEPTNATAAYDMKYSAMWQPTNAPDTNVWQWFGDTSIGSTNLCCIPVGSIPNPCLITMVTVSHDNGQSTYATPLLFDTNNYASPVPPLLPPTSLGVLRQ